MDPDTDLISSNIPTNNADDVILTPPHDQQNMNITILGLTVLVKDSEIPCQSSRDVLRGHNWVHFARRL